MWKEIKVVNVHNKNKNKYDALLSSLLDTNVTTETEDTISTVVCYSLYITLKKAKEEGRDMRTALNIHT